MTDKIRIVHVTPRFLPATGGCEYYVYNLSRRLLERKTYDIHVVASKSIDFNHPARIDFKPPFIHASKKPLPLGYEEYRSIKIHRLPTLLNAPGTILVYGLEDELKKIDGDIYNLHEYLSNIVVKSIRILHRIGKPVVLTAHDISFSESISPLYTILWRLYNRVYSKTLCSVDKIIVQNRRDRRLLEKICGSMVNGRIHVVYNGVDTEFYDPGKVDEGDMELFKKKFNLDRFDKIILFVGRVEERKRIDLLIKMLYIIVKRYGLNTGLLIVGPDYGYMRRAVKLAEQLGLKKHVVFTGRLDLYMLRTAYMVSHIFATLSEQEAFGLTAVEAQSMGKPVVTHKWRGLDEVVKHGFNGFKASPFNYVEAASYVKRLIMDDELYNQLSANAYKVARERFSLDRMVEEIEEIYREILEERE